MVVCWDGGQPLGLSGLDGWLAGVVAAAEGIVSAEDAVVPLNVAPLRRRQSALAAAWGLVEARERWRLVAARQSALEIECRPLANATSRLKTATFGRWLRAADASPTTRAGAPKCLS